MTYADLPHLLLADPAVETAITLLRATAGGPANRRDRRGRRVELSLAPGARTAAIAAAVTGPTNPTGEGETGGTRADTVPQLVITATGREAEDLARDLRAYLGEYAAVDFPSWETLPHERLSPRSDTVGRRLAVLRRIAHPAKKDPAHARPKVVTASIRAVLQPLVAGLGEIEPVVLRAGDEVDLEHVVESLVALGYTRTELVERRGEFAVRGGIIDVFPPTQEHPLRVEFWGDTVEEIRWFTVADQRTLQLAEEGVWAPACREVLLTDDVRRRAAEMAQALPGVADLLTQVADGIAVEGMESLAPILVPRMVSLLDELPSSMGVIVLDPERVRTRAHDLAATSAEFLAASWSNAAAGNEVPVDLETELGTASYWTLDQAREHALAAGRPWCGFTSLVADAELAELIDADRAPGSEGSEGSDVTGSTGAEGAAAARSAADRLPGGVDDDLSDPVTVLASDISAAPRYRGDTESAIADLREWAGGGSRVIVITDGPGLARRVAERLAEAGVPHRLTDGSADETAADQGRPAGGAGRASGGAAEQTQAGVVDVGSGPGGSGPGFLAPAARLAVLTEADFLGGTGAAQTSTRDMRRMPSRRRNQIDPVQLRPGDFVVHEQHGVGRFLEMVQRTVQGATREYLLLEYGSSRRGQPGDRLFVPTDQLDQVTKYVGGEAPTLNKLGGSDWANTKSRARKHVRQIAGELIRLYSARQATTGHAFGPDTPWQRELEDAFAFVETPDQLVSIDEVKADMEKTVPMDRLICGDVGYGKTEIAVRAAFKAIQDGKQVAVLVPTTLLVQQHFNTFSERYAQFPVTVKALSRFQSDKDAKEVLAGLADGSVDLVIGTHRLLGSGVHFKDLGLVVVDEEQRFGVEHKEQLKAMRTAVDVLSMSATPIPRTLEMAVTGIREMSTLATPPEERHPILTFVGAYEEKTAAAAIRRELLRDGQVFFVHNKVSSIEKVASRLRELVPEARVATAHGQMGEHKLEQVVVDFWDKKFDVLVCTTIVETGLDISNANTLIVERADMLGLSQLHQLRGRVGRGRDRAYAYFFYPPEKPLTETAHDRLATIAAHTDLGAGMAVAMKDLEIRGAGNLLGGEQSGHIEGVGFDLYVRLVGEAVREFRDGGSTPPPAEVRIELPVDAHLPHEYVPGERLRLEAYRKLAAVVDEAELADIVAELTDRYGTPPPPVASLVEVARLRTVARAAGIAEIAVQGSMVRFAPVELRESQQLRLTRLYRGTLVKPTLRQILVPIPKTAPVGGKPLRDTAVLDWAAQLLKAVFLDDMTSAADAAAAATGSADSAGSAGSPGSAGSMGSTRSTQGVARKATGASTPSRTRR